MLSKHNLFSGLVAAGLVAAAMPAAAQEPAKTYGPPLASADCFRARDWQGWSAADENTAYLGVRTREVYKVELLGGGASIDLPGKMLSSRIRGSDLICSARDLDLKVVDRSTGSVTPLFPVSITKLTAAEVAALPDKVRPVNKVAAGG